MPGYYLGLGLVLAELHVDVTAVLSLQQSCAPLVRDLQAPFAPDPSLPL